MNTRELLLKELELWPLWSLRQPLPAPEIAKPVAFVSIEQATTPILPNYQLCICEDNRCVFVIENNVFQADEKLLFDNILIAMRLKIKTQALWQDTSVWMKTYRPQIVIAMGENVAQNLLQRTERLTELRGYAHTFEGAQLIASDALQHLLQHPQDKAQAWQDFCLVLQLLNAVNDKP